MSPKSYSLTAHVEMIHWITEYAPDSSSDDSIAVPPSDFDDDFERDEDTSFDWE